MLLITEEDSSWFIKKEKKEAGKPERKCGGGGGGGGVTGRESRWPQKESLQILGLAPRGRWSRRRPQSLRRRTSSLQSWQQKFTDPWSGTEGTGISATTTKSKEKDKLFAELTTEVYRSLVWHRQCRRESGGSSSSSPTPQPVPAAVFSCRAIDPQ